MLIYLSIPFTCAVLADPCACSVLIDVAYPRHSFVPVGQAKCSTQMSISIGDLGEQYDPLGMTFLEVNEAQPNSYVHTSRPEAFQDSFSDR